MRSPSVKENYNDGYDQRDYRSPSGFDYGRNQKQNNNNLGVTGQFVSPNRASQKYLTQEEVFYQDEGHHNIEHLRSPNRMIPEQPLESFNRDDLAMLTEDLRQKLNDEIRRNNALFEKCNELNHENTSLRIASRKSSYQLDNQNVSGPILGNVKASKFNSSGAGSNADLWAELDRLKQENEYLRKDTIKYLGKNH